MNVGHQEKVESVVACTGSDIEYHHIGLKLLEMFHQPLLPGIGQIEREREKKMRETEGLSGDEQSVESSLSNPIECELKVTN